MSWTEHGYPDATRLATAVAGLLRDAIAADIAARGQATLALAGGRTPWPVYRELAQAALPWSQVTLLPTDERCVAHDHPACNYTALRAAFDAAHAARLIPLTSPDGAADAAFVCAALAALPQPFTTVVLGMGGDAHTASLFPGAAQLEWALAADAPDALRIDPVPLPAEAPFPRVSLSLARLKRARALHLLIQGEAKRAVLHQAQARHAPLQFPISALLHDPALELQIHWSP